MSLDLVASPTPHHIPGYSGFCPQYKFREGNSFGSTTHKLLLDPTVNHAERLILSDRTADDYQVTRPAQRDIDIVQARTKYGDSIYKHPAIPGYEGFLPRINGAFGQTFAVNATEALSQFEQQSLRDNAALNQLEKYTHLQGGEFQPRTAEDKLLTESQFKLPLLEVRPECVGILRNVPVDEPPVGPPRESASPFFMDNSDPDKLLKTGFAGHIPFGYTAFGHSQNKITNSALCDFTSNYRQRRSTEWTPVTIGQPDPPFLIQPSVIYHKHMGQIPLYDGHIPGAKFRCGKTFGNDTRDAKRWLRGDYRT